MIEAAFLFLVLGIIAAALGFTNIAGASHAIAKTIAVILLIVFVVLLAIGFGVSRAVA